MKEYEVIQEITNALRWQQCSPDYYLWRWSWTILKLT